MIIPRCWNGTVKFESSTTCLLSSSFTPLKLPYSLRLELQTPRLLPLENRSCIRTNSTFYWISPARDVLCVFFPSHVDSCLKGPSACVVLSNAKLMNCQQCLLAEQNRNRKPDNRIWKDPATSVESGWRAWDQEWLAFLGRESRPCCQDKNMQIQSLKRHT